MLSKLNDQDHPLPIQCCDTFGLHTFKLLLLWHEQHCKQTTRFLSTYHQRLSTFYQQCSLHSDVIHAHASYLLMINGQWLVTAEERAKTCLCWMAASVHAWILLFISIWNRLKSYYLLSAYYNAHFEKVSGHKDCREGPNVWCLTYS